MCRIVFATFVSGHALGKWFNDPHNQWKWWVTLTTNHMKMFTSSFMKCLSNIAFKRSPLGGSTLSTIVEKNNTINSLLFFYDFMSLHIVVISVNYLVGWDNWNVSFGRFANESFYLSVMILTFWLSIICIELFKCKKMTTMWTSGLSPHLNIIAKHEVANLLKLLPSDIWIFKTFFIMFQLTSSFHFG
jgi:hypothetical protein